MWRLFVSLETFFIPKYTVYHNFRSKGWVVRDGVKFGVHYSKSICYTVPVVGIP